MVLAHWFMLHSPLGPGSVHDMKVQGEMVPVHRLGLQRARTDWR